MIRLQGAWRRVQSERLGVWQGGSTPSKKVPAFWRNGKIPWISPKDFGPATITSSQDRITDQAIANEAAAPVASGSLLVVARSNILRHSVPVAVTAMAATINQDIKALTPGPGVDADFLRYQLQARAQEVLNEVVRPGTTIRSLDDRLLRDFPLIIAQPDEQRRLVTELDKFTFRLNALEEQVQASVEKVDVLRAALLQEVYDGELTAGWRKRNGVTEPRPTVTVAEIAESLRYGSSKKSQRKGEVAVLRMGNIQDGSLVWDNLVFTSDQEEIEKHTLLDGDVLFNRTNSPELVGKTALYAGETPAIAAGYLIVIRCGPRVRPAFLAHMLNSPAGRTYSHSVKSDGVSQSNINAKKLGAFSFSLPPLNEQDEALRLIDITFAQAEAARLELKACGERLRRLRAQVLANAFDPVEPESTNGLTDLLAAVDEFKAAFAAARSGRSGERMTAATVGAEVEKALRGAGNSGLPFDRLADEVGADYETLKTAVFGLLSGRPEEFRQRYDLDERTMKLEFVGS